jgi:type II secretory pathway pseudopilin PulG
MKRQRGLNRFEFAVTVAIFGVLGTALLLRINAIQEDVERTEVDLALRNIRVGIQLAIGERIMRGEEGRIAEVAAGSPIDFATDQAGARPPSFAAGRVPEHPGQWAYDPYRRELAYQPRMPGAFADARELRWRYVARVDAAGRTVGVSLVGLN